MHTVFALLCFVVVIHWLNFPYPSGLLHWHCGNLTIAPVAAKQPWWIWINTSCEFIMNDCITTTKQSTTKPCAYFLGYTVDVAGWNNTSKYIAIGSQITQQQLFVQRFFQTDNKHHQHMTDPSGLNHQQCRPSLFNAVVMYIMQDFTLYTNNGVMGGRLQRSFLTRANANCFRNDNTLYM